jgi:uncharacterized protein YidB (DUF937 family)
MALTDILGKLGGQRGNEGGLAAVQHLFGGEGLQGIVSQLTSSGFGQEVQSWLGSGKNQPISGGDVQQAVDPQRLQEVAQQSGMSPDEVSDQVAQALPHLVDQATPNGQIPAQRKGEGLGVLKGLLKL